MNFRQQFFNDAKGKKCCGEWLTIENQISWEMDFLSLIVDYYWNSSNLPLATIDHWLPSDLPLSSNSKLLEANSSLSLDFPKMLPFKTLFSKLNQT